MKKIVLALLFLCGVAFAETVPQELKNGFPVSSTPLTAGSGKVPVGSGTDFQEKSISGDATLAASGALTVTKTNGTNFANSATTDTTNASNISSGTLSVNRGGTGSGSAPSSGQLAVGNAGGTAYAPQTVSGDGTLNNSGALTVTKTNGTSFAPSATTDTTNASNISSGSLAVARITSGTAAQFLISNATPATAWATLSGDGTLSNTGALTVTKTGGVVFASSATTDTTNAANITSGILSGARGGTNNGFMQFSGPGTSTKTFTLPNATDTIACIGTNQTWTGIQTFGSGTVKLNGATSGTITFQPTAVAGTNTITLPAVTGTVVTTGDSGTVTNAMLAGSISNANLANSTITIQGSPVSLGGSTLATNSTPQFSAIGIGGAAGGANTLKLYGGTSGSIIFQPTGVAGSNTITLPAVTGTVITSGDTGTVTNSMLAGSVDLTAKVTGVLPPANGGTGVATIPTAGQLAVGNAGGTAYAPVTLSQDGTITSAGVLTVTKTNNVAFAASATTDTTNAANISAGVLAIARGGTGQGTALAGFDALSPLTTKGDVLSYDGTHNVRVAVGTNGQVIVADSTQAAGWKWAAQNGITVSPPIILTGGNISLGTAIAPTTTDANADFGIGASVVGKRPFYVQTALNNTKDAFEVQNSAGTMQFSIDNTTTSNNDITMVLQTPKTAACKRQSITEIVTVANTATSSSATNLIPANATNIVVTYRVTAAITCTTSFSVGDGISATRFGTGISKALSTVSGQLKCSPPTAPFGSDTATTILITPDTTPADSSGRLEITVWYDSFVEPGS